MAITLHCCGESYYADERHVGRRIQCTKCGRILTIEAEPQVLSPPAASQPYSTPVEKAASWPRNKSYRRPNNWRNSPLTKIVAGGILLCTLVVWIVATRFTSEGDQHSNAPEVQQQTPVATQASAQAPNSIVPERTPVSLLTGTWIIKPRGLTGNGILKIENGSGLDAVVKFVTADSPRKTVWMLYIRAHEHKSVSGISVGSYFLRFALGRDWDTDARRFRRDLEFYQAGRQLGFTEVEATADEAGKYKVIEITLNEVSDGNLPREPINEIIFNEGDSKN
jgi:hypothetical protein